jgi:hypothetical protein
MSATLALAVGVLALGALPAVAAAPQAAEQAAFTTSAAPAPLTNLAHLDFLGDAVTPPDQPGHTTYRLAEEPELGVLWTYADLRAGGVYERIGGGTYDAATDTWGQGAFNADDLSRASVVYLRHWQLTGDDASRQRAYQLLRALTYLQTATGDNAGNVVLWMQPDGTLNPSAEPVELPDPSDSAESYWVARTVWALGEGYAAFADVDPEFAAFLGERLSLSLDALDRESLSRYRQWDVADGTRVPGWLIVDGADATAEAVLGLAAYVEAAPASAAAARARTALARYAEGIAAMSGGDATSWPYGAILPWTHSQSMWHGWGSQMAAGLARASEVVHGPALLRSAVRDTAVFTPYLLTATGPINGWLPTPLDLTQIAYGVDSRVQSLVAVADATGRPGFDALAGIAASWYFGANRAGTPMYDPATGRTFDGLNGEGVVNQNSGAESTIHGLLSMLALDARPDVAAAAQSATTLVAQDGVQVVEAETAATSGSALVATPPSAWTGESLWSGDLLELSASARATWAVPASDQARFVQPVVNLVPDRSSARLSWSSGHRTLGQVDSGRGGAQGVTDAPGALTPVTLGRELPAGATELSAGVRGRAGVPAQLDTLLLMPRVSRLVLDGPDGTTALLRNAGSRREVATVVLAGGDAVVRSYDSAGRLQREVTASGTEISVQVTAGGFTIVTPAP